MVVAEFGSVIVLLDSDETALLTSFAIGSNIAQPHILHGEASLIPL
jgi:hypothetical protein